MSISDIPYFLVFGASAVLGVFGVRIDEEPRHSVELSEGPFQLRRYEPQVLAAVSMEGGPDAAFKRLAGYILGANESTGRIAMTAPVTMPPRRIAMTAPVTTDAAGEEMTFSMPRKWTLETLPKPKDGGIRFKTTPVRSVAVVRFRGRMTEEALRARTAELRGWIAGRGLKASSEPVLAAYDPPFTVPLLRRNEIHIEVTR